MTSLFLRPHDLFRWLARPAVSVAAAPVLFGVLVLAGCGGGGDNLSLPAVDTTSSAATTAPAIPVKRQPLYDISGEGSYEQAVQNYNHVGEALYGQ